jgi:hypothetical protein
VLIEDVLDSDELASAKRSCGTYYPSADTYNAAPDQYAWLQSDPFAGIMMFPLSAFAEQPGYP